ncbi:MAG: GTP-binding protein [Turicibacter sp.]
MNKTIGIFAHVDAGKTSFAESLLYLTNTIKKRGRVDHQDTVLDHHDIERKRGITVFTDIAHFQYKESTYYLIDTPGHVDFSYEMERALSIMDAAILIISATDGVQSHTDTVYQLLRAQQIPTFIFINKMDREGIELETVLTEIRSQLSDQLLYLPPNHSLSRYFEQLVELDDELLEQYLNGQVDESQFINQFRILFMQGKVFPCVSGSALQNTGIDDLMQWVDQLLVTTYEIDAPFSGRIYQIRSDDQLNQVVFMKALSGTLNARDSLTYGAHQINDKVHQLRLYQGHKYEQVSRVVAGQVFGVTGLINPKIGDGVGTLRESVKTTIIPTLSVQVVQPQTIHAKELLRIFKNLEIENPALQVTWYEELQVIQIQVMGVIQLEVLKELIATRYNLEIEFGTCEIIYAETISNKVIGRGHYEPLGHYAEVHVLVEPGSRGSGITFESHVHVDVLPTSFQNLVQTHVFERSHVGILTGSKLTDVKITLLTGASHQKHTSGGDFREATYRAIRQALEKADNVLLEPMYDFKFEVDLELMGRVLTDIQKAHGTFNTPTMTENKCIITGYVPVSTFMDYYTEFISYTKGKGRLNLKVKGYNVCHNREEIINQLAYDKESDRHNISASIFCAKGSGFVVRWDEADDYMHV